MQNFTFLVLFRPIYAQKMKTSPPKGIWVAKLWSSCRDSAGKTVWISDFGRKNRLKFSKDLFFCFLFFWRSSVLGVEKPSQFRRNRVILFQGQWKLGSRSLAVVSLFQKSPPPPPFFKSWLSACPYVKSIEDQKKVFTAIWYCIRLEFGI